MTGSSAGNVRGADEELSDAILEEAAAWHARMREPEPRSAVAEARRVAFDAWLAADPDHRRAFAETQRLWNRLEAPVSQLLDAPSSVEGMSSRRRRLRPLARTAALAACLLIAIAMGGAWQDELIDRLRSDHMTAVGETRPLDLADGSRIVLGTDSAVTVDLGAAGRQVRLLRGEAWFDVATDRSRPFLVQTPGGMVRVTGTRFGVRLRDKAAIVSLAEGRVELTVPGSGHAPGITLRPGEQARLSDAGISRPTAFDAAEVTGWLRGQFVFYDTPLPKVVEELNRYRAGRIVVADGELAHLKVSGVFRTDDPDAALAAMVDTLPLQVTRLTDYLVLLH
jgi:transmembrane sensor